ncbi:T9SS type A sorting domain-containing protein [Reichenbachiella versicolor]|uniref:T9SS type A sorting domain-containing protein n=1 Tax=Reichenbachiella versicolor TaxID=1821036 RepID=UPI000D6DCF71|nr:FG-GAP-like repeat-containing protein [Reichenbachiella versicolor]
MRKLFFTLSIVQGLIFHLSAQLTGEFIFPSVIKNSKSLSHAWAGGINSGQFNTADLDLDGDLDLVVFDRSSYSIITFENIEDQYVLNPFLSANFPNIEHWVVMRDYNCDGHKDIFTYTNSGVRLLEAITENGKLTYESVLDPIKTQGFKTTINVFFNPTDVPVIEDMDGDGDLDMLFFDFAKGDFIQYHENKSTGCGMDLERISQQYGQIDACECEEFAFEGTTCHNSTRVLHVLGKTMMAFDHDDDGDMDLVISQEGCKSLSFLENKGTNLVPLFNSYDSSFPSFKSLLNLTSFPAAYNLDTDFDGVKDIVISINEPESKESIDFKNSSIVYRNGKLNPFLQNEMIDVGEYSYPSWVDIDNDGNIDLVLGNYGSMIEGAFKSSLTLYRNRGTDFEYVTDDYLDFSKSNRLNIRPQFIDINSDGLIDLVFTSKNGANNELSIIINESGKLDINNTLNVKIDLEDMDQAILYDYDQNGKLDVLHVNRFGEINFFRNTGTNESMSFIQDKLNILQTPTELEYFGASIAIGDVNGDFKDDLIETRQTGKLSVYYDFKNNLENSTVFEIKSTSEKKEKYSPYFGMKSFPSTFKKDGETYIGIGNITGGIHYLKINKSVESDLAVRLFPNPIDNGILTIESNKEGIQIEIIDMSGNMLSSLQTENLLTSIDVQNLQIGMYVARVSFLKQTERIKFVIR